MENNGSSLAKISLGINIILIVAVIILFVKMPSSSSSANNQTDPNDTLNQLIPDDGIMKIGFFQVDSLQNNILLMDELEGLMMASQKRAEEEMQAQEKIVQNFERRWSNGGTLLPSEKAKYEAEAQKVQQDYMETQARVQAQFNQEQEQYTLTLIKRITNAATSYAQANGYDFILSSQLGQNLYYGTPNFNITNDLVRVMNADYSSNSMIEEAQPVTP